MKINYAIVSIWCAITRVECGFVEELIEVADILNVIKRAEKLQTCLPEHDERIRITPSSEIKKNVEAQIKTKKSSVERLILDTREERSGQNFTSVPRKDESNKTRGAKSSSNKRVNIFRNKRINETNSKDTNQFAINKSLSGKLSSRDTKASAGKCSKAIKKVRAKDQSLDFNNDLGKELGRMAISGEKKTHKGENKSTTDKLLLEKIFSRNGDASCGECSRIIKSDRAESPNLDSDNGRRGTNLTAIPGEKKINKFASSANEKDLVSAKSYGDAANLLQSKHLPKEMIRSSGLSDISMKEEATESNKERNRRTKIGKNSETIGKGSTRRRVDSSSNNSKLNYEVSLSNAVNQLNESESRKNINRLIDTRDMKTSEIENNKILKIRREKAQNSANDLQQASGNREFSTGNLQRKAPKENFANVAKSKRDKSHIKNDSESLKTINNNDAALKGENSEIINRRSAQIFDTNSVERDFKEINKTNLRDKSIREKLRLDKNSGSRELLSTNLSKEKNKDTIKNEVTEGSVSDTNNIRWKANVTDSGTNGTSPRNLNFIFDVVLDYCKKESLTMKQKPEIEKLELVEANFNLGKWVANYPQRLDKQIKALARRYNEIDEMGRYSEMNEIRLRDDYLRQLEHHFVENIHSAWIFKAGKYDSIDDRQITRDVKNICQRILPEKLHASRGVYRSLSDKRPSTFVRCDLFFEIACCENPISLYVGVLKQESNTYYAIGIRDENAYYSIAKDKISVVDYIGVNFKTGTIKSTDPRIITSRWDSSNKKAIVREHLADNPIVPRCVFH